MRIVSSYIKPMTCYVVFDIDLCLWYSYIIYLIKGKGFLHLNSYFNLTGIGIIAYCFIIVYTFRVDLNLSVKVGDFGFTREASCKASQSQKCPVKWMPPEMLQDGISTEKTDVVGYIKIAWANGCANYRPCHTYYHEDSVKTTDGLSVHEIAY